jgi:hypothetical protein
LNRLLKFASPILTALLTQGCQESRIEYRRAGSPSGKNIPPPMSETPVLKRHIGEKREKTLSTPNKK